MKQLGSKVLNKIHHLIVQIDKPNQNHSQRNKDLSKTQINISKHKKQATIQPLQKENDQDEIYRSMSYRYLHKIQKIHEKHKDNIYDKERQYEKFKVKNKRTLQILNKTNYIPIQQRVDEITNHKQKSVERLKFEMLLKEKQEKFHQNEEPEFKGYSKSQLKRLVSDYDIRNKQRIEKRNNLKLKFVKKEIYKGIPEINKSSGNLCSQRNLKKHYSDNVFVRFQQYNEDRSRKNKQFVQQIRQSETPFKPIISNYSRMIASKSKIQKSIQDPRHSFSHSFCCIKPEKYPDLKNSKSKIKTSLSKSNLKNNMKTKIDIPFL